MELIFDWKDLKNRGRGLTFDDVLLVPTKTDMRSRRDPDLSTNITKKLKTSLPFISANMDTVTESEMLMAMDKMGGFGILHRFMSIDEQVSEIECVKASGMKSIAASIGVNQDYKERTQALVNAGVTTLTVDIAHGHSVAMLETIKWLKDTYSDVEVIAGNVATPQGVNDLVEAGADAVKVGIGPGSMCTTRVIAGCGLPQLTAIAICSEVAREKGVPVIADGGLKTSGDIIKALAAGADSVMLGSLLSGTLETPGPIRNGKKQYRGMASKAAQVSWRGELPEGMAAEGEATYVPIKGHVSDVLHELAGGLRSGMTYINAKELSDIRENARFIEMSAMGTMESRAHGLNL